MLFTGVMLTKSGPKALEYNARFGDPETQTLPPLLKSDLAEIMVACVEGCLHEMKVEMYEKFCTVVIISARGYPGAYPEGVVIEIDSSTPRTCMLPKGWFIGPHADILRSATI